jgi:hypothetical protein
VANINQLRGLDTVVRPAHHIQNRSEHQLREASRQTNDFLQELSNMQEQRKYAFAADTIEGIYTTVEHSRHVSAGQLRAINNIRKGVGDEEL